MFDDSQVTETGPATDEVPGTVMSAVFHSLQCYFLQVSDYGGVPESHPPEPVQSPVTLT